MFIDLTFYAICLGVVIFSLFFDSHTTVLSIRHFFQTKKSATSINIYDKNKILSRASQSAFLPILSFYLLYRDPSFDEIFQLILASFFLGHLICALVEMYRLKYEFKSKFKFLNQGIIGSHIVISHAFFDFAILLAPISLNLIAFYAFKDYAQFIVQLIVFFNGAYIFYQAYVFKNVLAGLYDQNSFSPSDASKLLESKIFFRLIIMLIIIYLWTSK
tara:strand:+ start:2567 stop:3217 length:651 start_codon:yes stop_codon:yes gene_type:complete